MPHELLQTKLYIPPTRPQLVPRPRLIERLNEGLRRKLTLISAPAGFGKTTLVSDWVRQSERPGAWLSLDENDNDPIRFWSYLIAALSSIQPNLGQAALALLHAPQAPSITVTLIPLLNEMTALPDPIALVLDDYHVIEAQPIHDALTFLLDHLPPQMHLVITTRADPPLPLSRLRGRGQLTELRQTDLRFTAEEAATFLNGVMRLNLSAADVAALEERTEGWITGLQLAALSLRGAGDISGFIASFTGSQRYILDYLTDEVLSQQPEAVQTFLRQTSILGRLSGPLCDAVARRANSQTLLESLEVANMFIVSLDNEQRWYRYHHLFADLLRHQLKRHHSDQIPELYRRASQWFEKNELVDEAINYALLAKDFDRAANLIEQTAETLFAQMLMRAEISTLLGWLRALPDELVQARFRLCLTLAWVLLLTARKPEDLQSVEDLLQTAEGQMPPDETEELTEAHGHLAALRSYLALTYNDYAGAIVLARQALSDLPKDNRFLRGAISFNLATACWLNGDVVAAGQAYGQAAKDSRAAGNFFVALEALNNLGTMEAEQGHLHRAVEYHWQAVQMARDSLGQPGGPPPFAGSSYLGLAEVLREWNQLAEADQALETGLDLTRQGDNLEGQMIGYIISARVRQAQGDGSGALGAIATARQLLRPGELPALTPWLAAVEARLWLAQGNLPAAVRWVQGCGLDLGDAEAAFHRFPGEYTTLARVFIAQEREGAQTAVLDLLARMLSAMKAKNRTGRVIEILALQALALQTHNKLSQALTLLEQALALAESEEYVRVFVDEGPPMAVLLTRLNASREGRRMKDYISKLLAAFGEMKDIHPSALIPQPLVEPLTERELELLRLIATGYANREIADELVIALGTVKKHISNIYGKLGVQSRTQAIAKGRDLGLL